jgi:hypothetical protein
MSRHVARSAIGLSLLALFVSLCGCASYTAPGRGANLYMESWKGSARSDIKPSDGGPVSVPEDTGADIEIVQRKATAPFPAHLVVVRIQEPGYQSMTNKGVGQGRYSVVTVRDIEKDEDFERLGRLPSLAEIAPLSHLLLPNFFQSDKELRQAAARVQADMLLVYTVDTTFLNTNKSTPLSVVTLGFGPTINVRVITTVAALLMDTQTGYVYGMIEETANEQATTAAVSTQDACDALRLKTERRAFESFLAEFDTTWPKIVQTYKK